METVIYSISAIDTFISMLWLLDFKLFRFGVFDSCRKLKQRFWQQILNVRHFACSFFPFVHGTYSILLLIGIDDFVMICLYYRNLNQ